MNLIAKNQNGRIYVKKLEIEKNVYLFIKEFYPHVKCYAIDYKDNVLDIYIKASAINSDKYLENFQKEIETYFNEKVGIYFKSININIK